MSSSVSPTSEFSPWPHRLACLLVCATFPLIWVGGLVTTYDAGMAVPDWPNTYGYNLFLYPWQTWVAGPWDLFIEHGHRLLGALVGMITIGLVVAVWRSDNRPWMRGVALAALAAVILQGVLGGQRVLLDSRTVAMIHGCFGPAFFAFTAAIAVFTSRWWRDATAENQTPDVSRVARLAWATTAVAYLQLILGAQLRHQHVGGDPNQFRVLVLFHLFVAAALAVHAVLLARRTYRLQGQPRLARPAAALAVLVGLQLMLGASTWVVKYGWPAWFSGWEVAQAHVNTRESLSQVLITTAHVATGSLILAVSLLVAVRSARLARGVGFTAPLGKFTLEAAL